MILIAQVDSFIYETMAEYILSTSFLAQIQFYIHATKHLHNEQYGVTHRLAR